MRDLTQIAIELKTLSDFVSSPYDNEPIVLQDRLRTLTNYLQISGEIKADCQYLSDNKLGEATEKALQKFPNQTPTVINNLAKREHATYNRLLVLSDRLNRSITHQIDAIRTLLSYIKSEILNQN